jgi:hypothetical protein
MNTQNKFSKQFLLFSIIYFSANNIVIASGFVAGTQVATPKGFVPIEQIKVGDKVKCTHVWDGSETEGTVAAVRKIIVPQIVQLKMIDEEKLNEIELEVASDHDLW